MLGNLKTHNRNIVGDSVMYLVRIQKNAYGALIESAVDAASKAMEGNGIEKY